MTLFMVQHGKARPETKDPERSLTEQGAEIAGRVADWAAQVGWTVDQIRHSEKRRAEQTATILAKQLGPSKGVIAVKGLSPKDDVHQAAASLRGDQGSIMLVGHLPHLTRLVSLLLTGNPEIEVVRFRNAGIACLTQQEGKWAVDWVMSLTCFGKRGKESDGLRTRRFVALPPVIMTTAVVNLKPSPTTRRECV